MQKCVDRLPSPNREQQAFLWLAQRPFPSETAPYFAAQPYFSVRLIQNWNNSAPLFYNGQSH